MATILIVDDRPTNRQVLLNLLGYTGHRLLEATNGEEALARVRSERPDLVITDILMPKMDGFKFVQQLRADPSVAATNVVFYTATYRTHEARVLAAACGVDHVLAKPSDPETILATVSEVLGTEEMPTLPARQMQSLVTPDAVTEDVRKVSTQLEDYLRALRALRHQMNALVERAQVLEAEREQLRRVADEFSKMAVQLQATSLRLAAMAEMGFNLSGERDFLSMMRAFCQASRRIIGAQYTLLGVLESDEQTLRELVADGVDAQQIDRDSVCRGPVGRVLSERAPVRVSGFGTEHAGEALPGGHSPTQSFLGAPLLTPTQLYGWVLFANKWGAEEFSEEDEELVASMARQFAVVYENLQFYDQLQRHAVDLQLEINERKRIEQALRSKDEELRAMTQQLWQAAKLATMGELAASIAHELNNPLATVSLRVEALLEKHATDEASRHALEVIEQEVDRMANLVSNLLQFSRRTPPQISTLDVCEEIDKTMDLIHHHLRNYNITVAREFDEDVPMVFADRQQLRQLLLNLFTNASDAMAHGGTMTICGRATSDAELGMPDSETVTSYPHADSDQSAIVIEVADTGTGIAPENLNKVMEPFFTTKEEGKGTGLGLAICRRIVQEHRGSFGISSKLGEGTTVRIVLPVRNGANAQALA